MEPRTGFLTAHATNNIWKGEGQISRQRQENVEMMEHILCESIDVSRTGYQHFSRLLTLIQHLG